MAAEDHTAAIRRRLACLRETIAELTRDIRWVYDKEVQAKLTAATQEVADLQKHLFKFGAGVRDSNP